MMAIIYSLEVWLVVAGVTLLLLMGFGMFARWCSFSTAVRIDRLEQLRVGQSMDEVRTLLGPPRQIKNGQEHKEDESGPRQWIYGARMKRHVLLVEFNTHGQLQSFAHGVPGAARSHPRSPET